ncbi:MAG: M81 family metallopeptidase [Planctomycetota bacterium]
MAARVGIIALLHESNTFLSQPTTLELFQQSTLVTGNAVRDVFAGTFHEVGGFFAGLEEQGLEAVPLFAARTMPYGAITAETMETLLRMIREQLAAAGPLDGLLVAPHGATVSERELDADGYWLEKVRGWVGKELPIIGTLDAHANLSPRMVSACEALIAYRSNPHLDQRERGMEAARLLARQLRGEVRPTMAAAFPPLAINIERQLTTEPHCVELYRQADLQLQLPGVLSNSVLLGFPYADVPEMGSSFIVVTNDDRARAQQLADDLAAWLWQHRQDFVGQLISIEAALERAERIAGPVGLLDMGDNVGGGSPGDSTFLAQAIVERRIPRSLVVIYDPESVQQARAAGVGARVTLAIGGHTDRQHGAPLVGEFEVVSLHDGEFTETQARHGGLARCQQGLTAVVRGATDLTIILTSLRMPPFSLGQITSCGLDPTQFHLLVAKGVIAPVAAYAPICRELIRVNTPGVTTADMKSLRYEHRRRPMFPFEDL